MFPYGNGFNTINHREYHIIEANFLTLSLLMKHKLKLAIITFGFGLQSSQTVRKTILGNYISSERNMLVAEQFIQELIRKYGKHNISTDGGGTLYPQACKFLKLKHHIHSSNEKSLIERKSNT